MTAFDRIWRLAVIGLAALVLLAPLPPHIVERHYSSLVYPLVQRGLTTFSNLFPFALIDVLIAGLVVWLVLAVVRTVARARTAGRGQAAIRLLGRVAAIASLAYLGFVLAWGLNYRRLPLTSKVRYEPSLVTPDSARVLAHVTVREVNALYERARRAAGPGATGPSLADAFAQAQNAVGVLRPALPGRPKPTVLGVYFRAAGVDGMTDPFFLETLVASDLLPFERPFVVAHEWSHLAGFADEGEASFVGWLTCTKGSDAARYSGWLFLYGQVFAALNEADRRAVAATLDPGPRGDLREAAERARRNVQPIVADAGWRVYDRYLKANRIDAGTASYAEVVRLVLGVRLDAL